MQSNRSLIISYMQLRSLIGLLGILLPFICVTGYYVLSGAGLKDSVSMYYYTNMRDVFVGILICISLFLITYKGYESIDNIITNITGTAGIFIALFPCKSLTPGEPVGVFLLRSSVSDYFHSLAAVLFFFLIAVNSLFIFTKSNAAVIPKTRKYLRNAVYRISGSIILLCLVVLAVLVFSTDDTFLKNSKVILLLEVIMLFSYGTAWLVKGGTLLKD